MPRDLDAVVQQFLTNIGELDAFMPRAFEAITLRARGTDYQSAVEKALKIGSECAKLAHDEVGPKLREAFPWRDEL